MKKNKIILPIIMLLLLIVATIGVTFAVFTFTKEGTVENTLETSTIMLTYTEGKTGIILNEAYPMSDERGKLLTGENNTFDFTVTATLGKSNVISYEVSAVKIPINDMTPLEDNEVKLYLERAIDPDTTYSEVFAPSNYVPRDNQTDIGSPVGSMILDSGTFTQAGTTIHNYRLRMWIDENASIPSGESRKYGIKINVYAKQDIFTTPIEPSKNENITAIYQYNQNSESDTFCVTGEESTCKEITNVPETYETGTIIKYKVNDTSEKYFHVMFDNGNTLTLQQRENLLIGEKWYASARDNTKGPLTILPLLEEATSGWSNVLIQTYTLGSTIFKDNAFTGCGYDDTINKFTCTTNTYILEERTARARMITAQEAYSLGCVTTSESVTNCPIWMYNYLYKSTSYGGTMNATGKETAYWTSNAVSSSSTSAWGLGYHGKLGFYEPHGTTDPNYGTRAVIMINK